MVRMSTYSRRGGEDVWERRMTPTQAVASLVILFRKTYFIGNKNVIKSHRLLQRQIGGNLFSLSVNVKDFLRKSKIINKHMMREDFSNRGNNYGSCEL